MTVDMDTVPKGRRIAVIGSGLAGLTTAYLLRQRGFVVYLIEKSDKLGFHSSSIDIPVPDDLGKTLNGNERRKTGKRWTVDVPMRSFQGGYYPHLIALYRHLGIPMIATSYTFSFTRLISSLGSSPTSDSSSNETPRTTTTTITRSSSTTTKSSVRHSSRSTRPHFMHSGASGKSIPSLPSSAYTSPLSLLSSVITLISYAGCYILLLALSFLSYHHLLPSLFSGTLWDFTEQISIFLYHPIPLIYTPFGIAWRNFVGMIVIPLFSSVGTMPESEVWGTNVKVMLDYIHKTVGTDHYHPAPGFSARTIAETLAESVTEQGEGKGEGKGYLRLDSQVNSLKYGDGEIILELVGEKLKVDRVVLATPASVASTLLGMLEGSLADEREEKELKRVRTMKGALKGVRYKETIVVTHRDSSILPNQADVRDINLIHPASSSRFTKSCTKTISNDDNDTEEIPYFDPREGYTMATHVIRPPSFSAGTAVYQTTNPCLPIHRDSVLGIARLERALPLSNPTKTIPLLHPSHGMVYLAGSYACPGIPLLEGCVGSAKRVMEALIEDLGVDDEGDMEMVDWSKGRGGLAGRLWRWRKRDGL